MSRIFLSFVTGMIVLSAIVFAFVTGFGADAVAATTTVVDTAPAASATCRTIAVTITDPFAGSVSSVAQQVCSAH
ncbi:MAG: hypothetical protein AAF739_01060 [Pseudomonadota bacterium]